MKQVFQKKHNKAKVAGRAGMGPAGKESATQPTSEPNSGAVAVHCAFGRMERPEALIPHPRNPNRHDDRQIELLAKIIRHQGWRAPIVLSKRSGFVVVGHGRLMAAQKLGLTNVPVDVQEFKNEADELAHLVADNRIAELADIDPIELAGLLRDLDGKIDLDLAGFDAEGLDELGGLVETSDVDAEPQIDKADELRKKWKVKLGQIWELGEHRMMCGDCRRSADVLKVLDGDTVRMVWTDPPYGVGYEEKCKHLENYRPQNRKSSLVSSDDLSAEETEQLATEGLRRACESAAKGCSIYVAVPAGPLHARFQAAVDKSGFTWKHTLVWVKNHFVMGRSDYHYRHEPILFGWKEGAAHCWVGGRDKDTVFEVDKPTDSDMHPTMKPVALVVRMMENSSRPGDVVYEPFCGSGTTIIACEQLGRKCRAMEISPGYVAVAIQRWADATGKTPKLLNG